MVEAYSMAILIIGGSGFIGSRVVDVFVKNHICVLPYDIINSGRLNEKAKWVQADILDLSAVERLLFEYEIEAMIHLVGLPSISYCEKNPHFSFQLNVLSVQNALEAMRKTDIEKIIFASSAAVYGYSNKHCVTESDPLNPNNIYGYHKLMAEEAIRAYSESYGLKYVILRLFNVYGGNPVFGKDVISIFIRRALSGEPLIVKGPKKFRDFVHVDDVANAFLYATRNGDICNFTINIGSGERISLGELAELVKSHFPNVEIREEQVSDDGTGLQADISLARKLLEFNPRNPIEGISNHIAAYAPKGDNR